MDRNRNHPTPTPPESFVPISLKGRIGETAAWCIAVIAWGISYVTQVQLALGHGFHGWNDIEAFGQGLLADLASLAMMCLALDQAERGRPAKLTWLFSLLAALMMEWANVTYALGDPVGVVLHAWAPFLAVGIVFVLVHIRRTNATSVLRAALQAEPEPQPDPPVTSAPVPALPASTTEALPETATATNGRQRVTFNLARQAYRKLAAKGPVTGSAMGEALGVSHVMGRKWLKRVRDAEAKPRPFRARIVETDPEAAA